MSRCSRIYARATDQNSLSEEKEDQIRENGGNQPRFTWEDIP